MTATVPGTGETEDCHRPDLDLCSWPAVWRQDPPAARVPLLAVCRGASTSPSAGYVGLMQADAFDGYNELYKAPAETGSDP